MMTVHQVKDQLAELCSDHGKFNVRLWCGKKKQQQSLFLLLKSSQTNNACASLSRKFFAECNYAIDVK